MEETTKRRIWLLAYFVPGTAVGLYLVYVLAAEFGATADPDAILQAVPVSLLVIAYFLVPLYAATRSWRMLFPASEAPAPGWAVRLTWIGLSVNWLLPVAMLGGEVVKFRLAIRSVQRGEVLVASLLGDKTIQVATQLLYTLMGVSILAWGSGRIAGGVSEAVGFVLFCLAVYLFYRLQRAGLFAGAARRLKAFTTDGARTELRAARIDEAVEHMYRRSGRWWSAVGWRMSFRILMAGEFALVLWWLDQPVGIAALLALESISQASRVASLVVPAALGAQEAAIVAAGLLLGYPAEAMLAVALCKRARELVVGGSGLIAWQVYETRRLIVKTR